MRIKHFFNKNFLKAASFSFYTVFTISVFAVLLCMLYPDKSNVEKDSGIWLDESGMPSTLDSFNRYDSIEGKHLPQRVFYTADIKAPDTSIIFRARSCYVNIYADGVLLQNDYRKNTWFFGISPGSRWHIVSIPPSVNPVTICLEVTACYTDSDGLIDNFYIGNTQHIFTKVISGRITEFILCSFLQLCGLVILILYYYMRKHYDIGKDLLYLGSATFFSAQWSGMETLLWQLFLGHSEAFHMIGYVSLAAIPVTYGILAYHRLKGKLKTFSMVYSFVSAVTVVILSGLHLLNILEFHYSLIVVHFLVAVIIPLMIPLVLSYMDTKNKKASLIIIIPLLIVLTSGIIIAIIKYNLGMYNSYSNYVRIALLSFLLCLIIFQFKQIMETYSNGMQADVLADLALTDYMTGLYNRTAFNSHIEEYNHIIDSFSPLGIIQFDVNNLKKVNDTLGHEKGDMMIKAVADGLKYAFNDYPKICRSYRTGGDEFLTIINAVNSDEIYKECIARLFEYCDNFNKQPDLGFTLTIAHGYVMTKGGKTLSEAIDEADVLMYENKRMLKGLIKNVP